MTTRREFLKHASVAATAFSLTPWRRAAAQETSRQNPPAPASRPNILFILADDLGYGDLGCYGQQVIQTPHIDRLATQGARFTQHYAGSTVCAPSRSCLLTGQHTGHTYLRGNGDVALPYDTLTVAKLLQQAGYQTAMIGKSSVACNDTDPQRPNKLGFDHFFGVLTHVQAHYYYPPTVWRNGQAINLPNNHKNEGDTYAHDLYLNEASQWIKRQAQTDQPFFLLYAAHLPHASLTAPPEWSERYRGKVGPDRATKQKNYASPDAVKAEFAGMVGRLDWEVGQILDELHAAGLDDNTIVLFASDNGAMNEGGHLEEDFNSSGPLRGIKRDLTEGGIRTPLIIRWPGHIEPGTTCDHVSAFWDFLPTACELARISNPPDLDGISFLPAITGRLADQPTHPYLYWEFHEQGGKRAVRIGDFKAIQTDVNHGGSPIEVYNIAEDIDESDNIAAKHPHIVAEAQHLFVTARTPSPIEEFNWQPQQQ